MRPGSSRGGSERQSLDSRPATARIAEFIAIFYDIQILWERDTGVLAKLLIRTPRTAVVAGRAFTTRLLGMVLVLDSAFSCCLSITIAGIVRPGTV